MASRVVMPKLTDTMDEGVVLRWYKHEGDAVESGDLLAEIETDKAVMDLESYASGVIRKVLVAEGARVPAGGLIAVIGREGEDIGPALEGAPAAAAAKPPEAPPPREDAERPLAMAAVTATRPAPGPAPGQRGRSGVRSSPLARKLAREMNVDLTGVTGSGPGGRITKADVEKAAGKRPEAPAAKVAPPASGEPRPVTPAAVSGREIELSGVRRTIAKKMVQSKSPVPHFYLTIDLAMERCLDLLEQLKEAWGKEAPSVTAIIVKACAEALRQNPQVNASFAEDRIRLHDEVNIGIAVGLEEGLIVPVLPNCERKSLREIGRESPELIARARTRKLRPEEFTGATFSISNLGMFGVEHFVAVITPPEAAVLAVGAVRQTPVIRDGAVSSARMMKVTLSSDHRVIDGVLAARFLQDFKQAMEQPFRLIAGEGDAGPKEGT